MDEKRTSGAWILAGLLLVTPFALYIAGYFWLGSRVVELSLTSPTTIASVMRVYPTSWLVIA